MIRPDHPKNAAAARALERIKRGGSRSRSRSRSGGSSARATIRPHGSERGAPSPAKQDKRDTTDPALKSLRRHQEHRRRRVWFELPPLAAEKPRPKDPPPISSSSPSLAQIGNPPTKPMPAPMSASLPSLAQPGGLVEAEGGTMAPPLPKTEVAAAAGCRSVRFEDPESRRVRGSRGQGIGGGGGGGISPPDLRAAMRQGRPRPLPPPPTGERWTNHQARSGRVGGRHGRQLSSHPPIECAYCRRPDLGEESHFISDCPPACHQCRTGFDLRGFHSPSNCEGSAEDEAEAALMPSAAVVEAVGGAIRGGWCLLQGLQESSSFDASSPHGPSSSHHGPSPQCHQHQYVPTLSEKRALGLPCAPHERRALRRCDNLRRGAATLVRGPGPFGIFRDEAVRSGVLTTEGLRQVLYGVVRTSFESNMKMERSRRASIPFVLKGEYCCETVHAEFRGRERGWALVRERILKTAQTKRKEQVEAEGPKNLHARGA